MSNKTTAIVFSDRLRSIAGYDSIRYCNPKFWDGRTYSVDAVFTESEEIASAYREQDVPVYPIDREAKSASELSESEIQQIEEAEPPQEAHDYDHEEFDYESMPWPKLKSLASSMTEGKVKNKKEALEVLRGQS